MKTKKFGKLMLNKKTVANLKHSQMKGVKGGNYTDAPCLPSGGCSIACVSDTGRKCAPETEDTNTVTTYCGNSDIKTACGANWTFDCSYYCQTANC